MRSDFDAVVSALSMRIFEVPLAQVQEAAVLSESSPDRSLLETLSELGHLGEEEKRLLEELSQAFLRHESATLSGSVSAISQLDASPLKTLARFRDIADWGEGARPRSRSGQRYEVRSEHGRGGMGRILAVWDRRMRRDVALKELLPVEGTRQGRVVARFLREARITGRLQHPSIIPVHEIGVRDDGALYYTMKLVRGQTLRQAIKASTTLEARMALLPHFLDLCQAIAYAHAHGVIHRDIKPSNVMIGEFGETQVIDWGLAKEVGVQDTRTSDEGIDSDEARGPELTMAGQLLGTPHYMSPEQAAGKHDQLDERSDVYALGAVLYELLTGSRPYQASTGLEALRKVNIEPPLPPEKLCPEAPAALVAVCRRAMEREPAARYLSASALANEIMLFQAGSRVQAYEYGMGELLARFVRRHRPVVVTTCVALALLTCLGAYSFLSLRARHAAEHVLRVKSEQKGYDLSILIAQRALEELRYAEVRDVLAACPADYRDWEWGRLTRALEEVQTTSLIAPEGVAAVKLMPDARSFLMLMRDGGVKVWNLPDLNVVHTYASFPESAWAAAVHPSGKEFAVYETRGGVVRFDVASTSKIASYPFQGGVDGEAVAYSLDGRYLLAAASGGNLLQWDLESGSPPTMLQFTVGEIHDINFSPDSRWLVVAGDSGRLQIRDQRTGELTCTLDAHMTNLQVGTQGAIQIVFSPDGRQLASAGCDATIKLWEVGSWVLQHDLTGHLKKAIDIAYSPDGATLASCSERTVKLWDTRTGEEKPTWVRCDADIRNLFFLPGGNHFFTVETTGRIIDWDLSISWGGKYLKGHTSEVNSVRFSPDGSYLASGAGHWLSGGDSRVLIWPMDASGQTVPLNPERILEGDGRWINQVAFYPDGFWLSGADAECKVVTWDWRTGDRLRETEIPNYTNGERCVVYSPDGEFFATSGWGEGTPELSTVDLWDTATNTHIRELSGSTRCLDSIAFSPDGQCIAGGSRDGTLHIWNVRTGAIVQKMVVEKSWIYGVAYSPDGTLIAASCDNSTVLIWSVKSGDLVHRLEGLQSRANKVTFNPEGTRVAACDERMVKVWNVETGAALLSLPHGAQDLAFSPDGRTLATAGFDGRIGIWQSAPWH